MSRHKVRPALRNFMRSGAPIPEVPFVGPLDGIVNIAAIWAERRLLTDYEGAWCVMRRSSDNDEEEFNFLADGARDQASVTSWQGGGNAFRVTTYDQSGNGRNATQVTAANQPQYVNNVINGMPVLLFDGTDDYLIASWTHTGAALSAHMTAQDVAIVSNDRILVAKAAAQDWNSTDVGTIFHQFTGTDKLGAYRNGDKSKATHPGAGVSYIASSIYDATNHTMYINGVPATAVVSTGSFSTTMIVIGAGQGGGSVDSFANVRIAELVLLSAATPTADHNTIGESQEDEFGISFATVS